MPVFKHPEYPEETLLKLESLVPCRESQVSNLLSIFGELPHAFVNCIECFTSRLLLEEILRQLQHLSNKEEDPPLVSCDTFNDFIRLFKQATMSPDLHNQTVYIVSHLQKILSHDHPPEYSPDFYAAYINILLGVFYPVCRDLKELRHLAALNFSKYCEPVVQGEGLSAHAHVELPYYSKFLLIAAYIASYNPARTDKRFFVKHHGKIKKMNFQKKHEKHIFFQTSNHLLGPKPFPLDRMLAILYSIVDSRVAPTANIFSQVSTHVFRSL
ncbi:hypothetical protein JD844_027611 [Phrynosoma platyrhinos]|uniref:Uncharacterized protein n=1 Tax=Phrynosoma platyrhinos TaxID=52577 RepID=A0ABQ7SGQ6_PHRPL|nr:hypothetical protein JD844_027611 [Phrynosoma platyrhinos]